MDMLTQAEQSVFIFAARYSHTKQTGGAMFVVYAILKNWDRFPVSTQQILIKEAKNEATCNMEDWEKIIEKNNRP